MKKPKPIFDPATHYRIIIQGQVDLTWLQSFDSSIENRMDAASQMEDTTVLDLHTDQAGIIGLVRRLHGLGMTILQVQIVSEGGDFIDLHQSE